MPPTESWFEFIKAYGLGVTTLAVMVWWLKEELKASRIREAEANKAILDLTKESINSIAGVSKVIDAITPTIGQIPVKQQNDLNNAVIDLKQHITTTSASAAEKIINALPDD